MPIPLKPSEKAQPKRILLAGGGTGGHLFPALAVAQRLRELGAETLFVGTRWGVEANVVPQHGFHLKILWLSGFRRRQVWSNLLLPLKVVVALLQSLYIVLRFKPQAALGTGGYVCGPALLMAALMGVPIYLQEQNSYPGVTTRLLTRWARRIFLNFEEAAEQLPSRARWTRLANPVRPNFAIADRSVAQKAWELHPELPTLLVFGGSQGAQSINRAVTEILPQLAELCNLIWSRGKLDQSALPEWRGRGRLIVKPFIDDMPSACAAADLAICRSGAMTLSELQAACLPAILIPYPFAAADHQRRNAVAYLKRGAARLIVDRELSGVQLLAEIKSLLERPDELAAMRQALQRLPVEDSAGIIAAELLNS